MAGINLALGAATGVYMPDFSGGGDGGSRWGGLPSERKEGLMNRVFDRMMDSPVGSAIVIGVGVTAAVGGLAYAGATGEAAFKAHMGASQSAVHIAAMAPGTARPDYGFPNLTIAAIGTKDDMRGVHAAADSEPSRGALALGAMIGEMRLSTNAPIVVHAYDPFVKDEAGKSSLDLDGVRKVAPLMAKDGVKVAMMPYAMTDSPTGREFSKIMKASGIAVFAQTADRGIQLAPDILTVRGATGPHKPGSMGNFEVKGDATTSLGRMAGAGAIYSAKDSTLVGSAALGSEMQSRMDAGAQIVVRGGAKIRYVRSVQAVPGVRIHMPPAASLGQQAQAVGARAQGLVAVAAARAADQGRE